MSNISMFYCQIIILLSTIWIISATIATYYVKRILVIFKKVIMCYIVLATLVITVFGIIYFGTILYDITTTISNNEKLANVLNKDKNNKESKEYTDTLGALNKEFISRSHFSNLSLDYFKLDNEKKALSKYFFDSIYFSAVTFFTIGYGDIYPIGIMRIFIIIEGFLGAGFAPIFIALALTNEEEIDKNKELQVEEEIKIRLNRGENIVGIFNMQDKYIKIVLIDKIGITNMFMLTNNHGQFRKLIEKFEIQYSFYNEEYNKDLYYAFAIYIQTRLEDIYFKEAIKSTVYNEFNIQTAVDYFKELNSNLKDNSCDEKYYIDYLDIKNKVESAYQCLQGIYCKDKK